MIDQMIELLFLVFVRLTEGRDRLFELAMVDGKC